MLYLNKKDYDAVLEYCRRELPREACGLLAGRKDGEDCYVETVYFLTNTEYSCEHFSMEPREQFAALKDMRVQELCLVGNFHSHPQSLALPSSEDKRLFFDREFRYLILSLMEKEPVLKAFLLEEKGLREEMLMVLEKEMQQWFFRR